MNQITIELAISALEAEKAKVEAALTELKSNLNGQKVTRPKVTMGATMPAVSFEPAKAGGRKGRRRLSAAGRKALSDAARRRWAKARAAGKSTL